MSRVGALDHVVEPFVRSELGEADAHRCPGRRFGQRADDALEALLGRLETGPHQHADELVTSVAHQHVVRSKTPAQRRTQLPQEIVAVGVAARVVDSLQVVDVEERDHQLLPDPVSSIDCLSQLVVTGVAGQHPGEIVSVRTLEFVRRPATLERGLLAIERGSERDVRHRVPVPRRQLRGGPSRVSAAASRASGDVTLGGRAIGVVRSLHVGSSPYSPFSCQVTASAAPPSKRRWAPLRCQPGSPTTKATKRPTSSGVGTLPDGFAIRDVEDQAFDARPVGGEPRRGAPVR